MTKVSKNNPILSIILVNYNFGEYIENCLLSIDNSILTSPIEIIITDNISSDDSFEKIQKINYKNKLISYIFHQNNANVGFSIGNNIGIKQSNINSKYVLFLNPDTTVEPNTLQGMINYFEENNNIDAATCNVILAKTGQTQLDCHRSIPTPWNSFWHFFGCGIPQLFPKSKIFNSYYLRHLDYSKTQLIEACVGAFMMMKRSVGQKIGWWNEKYFMYGEDLEICIKLKKYNYNLYFIPNYKITHYQGIASGIKKTKSIASRETRVRSARATTNAMRIFYKDNLINNYPTIFHPIIYLGINFIELLRVFKAKYL